MTTTNRATRHGAGQAVHSSTSQLGFRCVIDA